MSVIKYKTYVYIPGFGEATIKGDDKILNMIEDILICAGFEYDNYLGEYTLSYDIENKGQKIKHIEVTKK